jgi:uncharacterized protein (TIGR03084 family)
MTDRTAAARAVLDDLDAEESDLEALLSSLGDAEWSKPTPAAGWDVRDQVSHLADTEEAAHDTMTDGPRSLSKEVAEFGSGDAWTESGCEKGRALDPMAVLAWWAGARRRTLGVMRSLDPDFRVPWGLGMGVRAFGTARLMEHWAHGLDIRAAVDRPGTDTERLRHVAWLGANALPYAFSVAHVEPPAGRTLRFELTGPDCAFGPADATDVVHGPTGQWCRLAVQRIGRDQAPELVAEGPLAELALTHARAFL